MKFIFESLLNDDSVSGAAMTERLQVVLNEHLPLLEDTLIQDLSHLSQAAKYNGGLSIDQVLYLKDNLYRCDYSYDWDIAWTCSGTQESGRVSEKMRFTLEDDGVVNFQQLAG